MSSEVTFDEMSVVELDPSDPMARDTISKVEEYLAALCSFDLDRMSELQDDERVDLQYPHWFNSGNDDIRYSEELLSIISIADDKSRTPHVFLEESRSDDSPQDLAVCYCRTDDCSGLWPIAMIDADANEYRPYACLNRSISPRSYRGRVDYLYLDTEAALQEPGETQVLQFAEPLFSQPYCGPIRTWKLESP